MLPQDPSLRRHHASRLLGALLAAAVAAGGVTVAGLAAPAPVLGAGPLPACRYDDILTTPRAYSAWSMTLVDTILRVPKSYVPPDLVLVSNAGIAGYGYIRALVIDDLRAMTQAASAAGSPIAVQSAYRSYASQQSTFQYWVNLDGYQTALLYSARPGHSEHQLGLAIDFKSAGDGPPWSGTDWGQSPAGSWMRTNAWQFGFIQSYPKGQRSKTCYAYESWHFRYVGVELAAAVHASGLTLREYLWRHFTTAAVGGSTGGGAATPPPSPSPVASQEPAPSPSAAPSEVPSAPASAPPTALPAAASPPPASAPASPASSPGPAGPVGNADDLDPVLLMALALIGASTMLVLTVGLGWRRSRSEP